MSLTSPAITELSTELGPFAVLKEWLGLWFDGNPHAVGGNPAVLFPRTAIEFGESPAAQPQEGVDGDAVAEIRCVIFPRSERLEELTTSLYAGQLATEYVLFHFWVSAKKAGRGQSQLLARTIAQLLKAILTNADARYPLAEKGILNLNVKGPEVLRGTEYAKRLVAAAGQLQYPILFGGQPTPAPDNGEQSLRFALESPLLANEYLLGLYQWNARVVRLTGASWSAWPPTGSPVVLGLEVGGVLTGDQIVIAPGVPNADATGAIALAVTVPITQAVRWRVVSAPIPELSAWHVTVNVTALPV